MPIQRISPDPSLSVRDLAGPVREFMKEKKNFDLFTVVKPKDSKTSWKTAPDIGWMASLSRLFLKMAAVSPTLCLASSKLKLALEKLDEELGINKTKMFEGDFADKVDTWLRICASHFRSAKKKYTVVMKEAGDKEKELVDAVLALMDDGGEPSSSAGSAANPPPTSVPAAHSLALVPWAPTTKTEHGEGQNMFKQILEKKDSQPATPSPLQARKVSAKVH